jgi:hypothetical protein
MRFLTRKSTLHVLVWAGAVAYLLFSPAMYAYWFLDNEKAVYSSKPFLIQQTTSEIKTNIDLLNLYDDKGVYFLEGWGFLLDTLPIEEVSREIILVSPTKFFIFETEAVNRKDVDDYFTSIQKNLTMAGFRARISKYVVPAGHYHVILSFNQKDGQIIYADTGFCIARTPNQLLLLDGSDCEYLHWLLDEGGNINLEEQIQSSSGDYRLNIDRLFLYNSKGVYFLDGWGFPTRDFSPYQTYYREIILRSPHRYYIFSAAPTQRNDVNEYFKESLEQNLIMTGFQSKINMNLIKPGTYQVLLVFKLGDDKTVHVNTNRCITRTSNDLILEDHSDCAFPLAGE